MELHQSSDAIIITLGNSFRGWVKACFSMKSFILMMVIWRIRSFGLVEMVTLISNCSLRGSLEMYVSAKIN